MPNENMSEKMIEGLLREVNVRIKREAAMQNDNAISMDELLVMGLLGSVRIFV